MIKGLKFLLITSMCAMLVYVLVCDIKRMNKEERQFQETWQKQQDEMKAWNIKHLPDIYDENGNKRN